MCNFAAGVTLTVLGVVLVVLTCSLSFTVVPDLVKSIIISEVRLENNTEQWERFESVPFGLTFNVRVFNISNREEVLAGGVPVLTEIGPYVYRCYQSRIIEDVEGDNVMYRLKEYLEFDAEASYPLTTDDNVTIVNVPYHGILQMAELLFPSLMDLLPLTLSGVFGVHNSPIMTARVGDLLFDGIPICKDPGLIGGIACLQIRPLAADVQNIEELEDGSLEFSFLRYKHDKPSELYVASRGLDDVMNLGLLKSFNGSSYLNRWVDPETPEEGQGVPSVCNMLNGTDSGIFPPFVNRDKSVYAFNTDVCRSVEIRYQYDSTFKDIPVARFAANEWLLDNHQGCFCLNQTRGITRDDGCLLSGAMELYTCVGALMVMTYPHFLFADSRYRNGVIGMRPNVEKHRIFVDLEPNTGTVIRGMKRAQFNVFMRPITSIPATQPLRTTLMPILWVEEGMDLPDDYANMIKNRLLANLSLVDILVPVLISVSCVVLLLGVGILVRVKTMNSPKNIRLTN